MQQRGSETTSKNKMCLQVFYRAGEGRLLGMQMSPVRVKLLRNAISTLAGSRWALLFALGTLVVRVSSWVEHPFSRRPATGAVVDSRGCRVRLALVQRNAISTLAGNRWVLVSITQRCLNAETQKPCMGTQLCMQNFLTFGCLPRASQRSLSLIGAVVWRSLPQCRRKS